MKNKWEKQYLFDKNNTEFEKVSCCILYSQKLCLYILPIWFLVRIPFCKREGDQCIYYGIRRLAWLCYVRLSINQLFLSYNFLNWNYFNFILILLVF